MRRLSFMHQHPPPLPPLPQSNGMPQREQEMRRWGRAVWAGDAFMESSPAEPVQSCRRVRIAATAKPVGVVFFHRLSGDKAAAGAR
jgi:hypothetical protein